MIERQWDRADWPAQIKAVAARFATRSRDEWVAVFDGVDACVTPVLSVAEATAHPQAARYFETVERHCASLARTDFQGTRLRIGASPVRETALPYRLAAARGTH